MYVYTCIYRFTCAHGPAAHFALDIPCANAEAVAAARARGEEAKVASERDAVCEGVCEGVCVCFHACMYAHTHTHTEMHAYKQVQYVSDHLPRGLRDHVYVYVCVYI